MKVVNNGLTITINGAMGHFPKEFVISALEKQMPKKPKLMEKPLINSKYWFYCPNCNASRHTDIKVNCCSYCGQALDWSEDVKKKDFWRKAYRVWCGAQEDWGEEE